MANTTNPSGNKCAAPLPSPKPATPAPLPPTKTSRLPIVNPTRLRAKNLYEPTTVPNDNPTTGAINGAKTAPRISNPGASRISPTQKIIPDRMEDRKKSKGGE